MKLPVGTAMLLAALAYCYSCLVGMAGTHLRFLNVTVPVCDDTPVVSMAA